MNSYEPGYFDRLRERHPYPGGWREHTRSTDAEDAATKRLARKLHKVPRHTVLIDAFVDPPELGSPNEQAAKSYKATREVEGRLHATVGWMTSSLFEGWTRPALRRYLSRHKEVRRVRGFNNVSFYDVEAVISAGSVASKAYAHPYMRLSVARVLQGCGSINEKLLEFVAATE